MAPRVVAVGVGVSLLTALPAVAQDAPSLTVTLRRNSAPEVFVSVQNLLADGQFLDALRSGFPLYMEYRVQLRQAQPLWDRTVSAYVEEAVVLYDPVRDRFAVETGDSAQLLLPDRSALERWLERVYRVGLGLEGSGPFYYEARVEARMLSDEDVDEAFAWLRAESGDSVGLRDPGPLARVARRLLMRVTPLPRVRLRGRTEEFSVR